MSSCIFFFSLLTLLIDHRMKAQSIDRYSILSPDGLTLITVGCSALLCQHRKHVGYGSSPRNEPTPVSFSIFIVLSVFTRNQMPMRLVARL